MCSAAFDVVRKEVGATVALRVRLLCGVVADLVILSGHLGTATHKSVMDRRDSPPHVGYKDA